MNLYIENRSFHFIKKAFKNVVKNTGKSVFKCIIVNKKQGFNSFAYWFFHKKKVYEVEYIIQGEKDLKKAIKYTKRKKNPIELTIIIGKSLSKKAKIILGSINSIIKIIDYSNSEDNIDFYESSKYIIYKTDSNDKIFYFDSFNLALGFDSKFQCKCSSCLGQNLYVAKNGDVSFCHERVLETVIGNINIEENYFNNKNILDVLNKAIEKRKNCEKNCEFYNQCQGYCPLESDCTSCLKEIKEKISSINQIKNNKLSLEKEHKAVIDAILKDMFYI